MKKLMMTVMVFVSLAAASAAFADRVSGKLEVQGDNLGISTSSDGFFAIDESVLSPSLKVKVRECLGKEVHADYNDRGMVVDLVSLSCN
jgi:hypothetical protein